MLCKSTYFLLDLKLQIVLSFILSIVSFCVLAQTKTETNAEIRGRFRHPPESALIVLLVPANGNSSISAPLINRSFKFSMTIDEPTLAYIRLQVPIKNRQVSKSNKYSRIDGDTLTQYDMFPIYIEPGLTNIYANDLLSTSKVTGSRSTKDWRKLYRRIYPIEKTLALEGKLFLEKYRNKDTTGRTAYNTKFDSLRYEISQIQTDFIKRHPRSYVSLYCLRQLAGLDLDYEVINPLFARLSDHLKKTKSGKQLDQRLNIARRTQVGYAFTDFNQTDSDGSVFQLSSLKGKYILLDFWASWCKPCREENPNIVKAYANYHDKGFEVVSVSLDSNRNSWADAIKKDKLGWKHVSDLKGWKNEVARLYGIAGIPQNVLIDPKGLIIARNLRGDALSKKFSELF